MITNKLCMNYRSGHRCVGTSRTHCEDCKFFKTDAEYSKQKFKCEERLKKLGLDKYVLQKYGRIY